MTRPLRWSDVLAWVVAGVAFALNMAGTGILGTAGFIVFLIVEATIILEFLGVTPEALR